MHDHCTRALLIAGFLFLHAAAHAEPIPVELRKADSGWQLYRGGEPYFIRGAGGDGSLEALAAAGGNSVRTWGGDPGEVLDRAHALGMTVTAGIWLGHERHGFDYSDPQQVKNQLDEVREIVLRYKDHPALLLWGVGNEAEGFDDETSPRVWAAINDAAALVKELDPNHPTMVVTAFIHGQRIDYIHRKSPAVDIHGINAYGGAVVVPERLRAGKARKPIVLTEFGPVGPWEMPTTDWGAPYEQTSTEKAKFYRQVYEQALQEVPDLFLGGYAFLWGHKMEGTATWFGMFLQDGSRTAAIDVMSELWSGKKPENLAPFNQPLVAEGPTSLAPGSIVSVRATVKDPEGGALRARWALRPESGDYGTGGDLRPTMPDIEDAIIESGVGHARVRLPEKPGAYRLFQYAFDDAGNAATANIPLRVLDAASANKVGKRTGKNAALLPISVYEDGVKGMPWAPSGWMGNSRRLKMNARYKKNTHEGSAAIRLRYSGKSEWAGIAWQHPPNDWGKKPGGYDLNGASALELWARGEHGGERVSFGVGLLGQEHAYPDSGTAKIEGITLTQDWQRFRVPLTHIDLSNIKTGFVVTIPGQGAPVTIYLDSIRYIR